jgi:hypothetical protein
MIKYIKKLKHRPENKRKQILVSSLIVCMSFVSIIWIYSLSDRFSSKPANQVASAENGQVKPFTLFKNSIASAYKNIAASVGNVSPAKQQEAQSTEKQIDLIVVPQTDN